MRDQYAGDVSDLLKFAFLRALVRSDRNLGIAWYYVPDNDGRPDGRHLEWHDEVAWRELDSQLHTGLSTLSERSVAALECANIWPNGTTFHREPMPKRQERIEWGKRQRVTLDSADVVFLDPDNGVGKTKKHASFSEIELLQRNNRAVTFITFPGRSRPHEELVKHLHDQLRDKAKAKHLLTLRTSVSIPASGKTNRLIPRARWFTIIDPDALLVARASEFADALKAIPRVSAQLESS